MNNLIWKTLSHGGRVKREWMYVGTQRGKKCGFPVVLIERHPDLRDYYLIRACAAMNVAFEPTGYCPMRDLEPIGAPPQRCPGCGCIEVFPDDPGNPLLCQDCAPSAPIADFSTPTF